MKVLWITNVLMPEVAAVLTNSSCIKGSGGWLYSLCQRLGGLPDIDLIIATVHASVNELRKFEGGKCSYYVLPLGKGNMHYNNEYEAYWREINEREHPDLVHIHGTEFSHGLAWLRACGNQNVVVSIQGLVSVIQKYVFYDVSLKEKLLCWQPKNLLSNENKSYRIRAVGEKEYLTRSKFFIGRTDWDRAHVWQVNRGAKYFHCEEMLRESFYQNAWNSSNIEKHSIFVSQANMSIKGLHQLLKALPTVIEQYPDTKVYVGGSSFFSSKSRIQRLLHNTSYFKYIQYLIKHLRLKEYVSFLAPLDEREMQGRYLKSNVFVIPSAIENSSNSLAEAQILGVPCVASYVGGTPTLVEHGKTGLLYRFEEKEMLAYYICRLFSDNKLAEQLSTEERSVAQKRHDRDKIVKTMVDIYNEVIKQSKECLG